MAWLKPSPSVCARREGLGADYGGLALLLRVVESVERLAEANGVAGPSTKVRVKPRTFVEG